MSAESGAVCMFVFRDSLQSGLSKRHSSTAVYRHSRPLKCLPFSCFSEFLFDCCGRKAGFLSK